MYIGGTRQNSIKLIQRREKEDPKQFKTMLTEHIHTLKNNIVFVISVLCILKK